MVWGWSNQVGIMSHDKTIFVTYHVFFRVLKIFIIYYSIITIIIQFSNISSRFPTNRSSVYLFAPTGLTVASLDNRNWISLRTNRSVIVILCESDISIFFHKGLGSNWNLINGRFMESLWKFLYLLIVLWCKNGMNFLI